MKFKNVGQNCQSMVSRFSLWLLIAMLRRKVHELAFSKLVNSFRCFGATSSNVDWLRSTRPTLQIRRS